LDEGIGDTFVWIGGTKSLRALARGGFSNRRDESVCRKNVSFVFLRHSKGSGNRSSTAVEVQRGRAMNYFGEIRKQDGQIPFVLTLEAAPLRAPRQMPSGPLVRSLTRQEINVPASALLIASLSAFSTAGLLLWTLLKLWLFER
jgi:hypothetical protein